MYFLRHAMPHASPEIASADWPLRDDAWAAVQRVLAQLPPGAPRFASTERRAQETAGAPAHHVRFDAAFDEVRRVGEPWGGNWAEMRRRWLAGEALDGWETQEAAFSRFGAGVGRALAESADAIVSTHGLVLTNWLVRRGLVPEAQAVAFWEDLAFPDLLLVDLDRQQVSRPSGP